MVDVYVRNRTRRKYWRRGEVERIVERAPDEVLEGVPERVRMDFCHQDATKGEVDQALLRQGVERMDPAVLRKCLNEIGGVKGEVETRDENDITLEELGL